MLKQCEVKKGSKTQSWTVTHHTLQRGMGKTRQTDMERQKRMDRHTANTQRETDTDTDTERERE